jgi:hypothetical protein
MLWEIREIVNGSIWSVNGLDPGVSEFCNWVTCQTGEREVVKFPNCKITKLQNSCYRSFSPSLNMYLMAGL